MGTITLKEIIQKYLPTQKMVYSPLVKLIPSKIFLKVYYRLYMGKPLNLKNPVTFNEKLQWLKLYDHNPLYTTLVDKYAVKEYIANKIGSEYVIPTLGVWDKFEDIDFDALPNQFVLKCTHDSGSVIVCRDKCSFDRNAAKKKLTAGLKRNYYWVAREWCYKNVKPRIIAEKYMEDDTDKELRDYKLYCFDSNVKATLLATNRQSEVEDLAFDYFDEHFGHLALTNHWHPNAKEIPHKPSKYDEMVKLARVLSNNIPHVRVDFYEVDGKTYFGELTFYDNAGFLKIHPDDWEQEWGNLIKLDTVRGGGGTS